MTTKHHHGASPGSFPDPSDAPERNDPQHQHAFILLGDAFPFLVHMTMFGMEEHCYQAVLRVTLPDEVMKEVRRRRTENTPVPKTGGFAETFFLGTAETDDVSIAALMCQEKRAFNADLFQGVPARPKSDGWPWKDTPSRQYQREHLVRANVQVMVDRVVYARHFDFGMRRPRKLTYVLFGEGKEAHMTNFQVKEPEFDHVLSLGESPQWLLPAKLKAGVHVTTGIDVFPADCPVHCKNPLPGEGSMMSVLYQGIPGRTWDLQIGKTWWLSTAVVNGVDPCANCQAQAPGKGCDDHHDGHHSSGTGEGTEATPEQSGGHAHHE